MTPTDDPRTLRPVRRFTILLPIVRPPDLLPFAVRSVLGQTVKDFELCIVCDGAPPETVDAACDLARGDDRIRVFPFPKGERHGEAHRAAVMEGAGGDLVAQIGDDDIWFPDHLAVLARGLRRADFASVPQIVARTGGGFDVRSFGDLSDPEDRARMRTDPPWNFFGPSECGYRLSAYRALPEAWTPAPRSLPSDLFMWRKFLARPELRFLTIFEPTGLKPPAQTWDDLPMEARVAAAARMLAEVEDPAGLRRLRRSARAALARRMPIRGLAGRALRQPLAHLPLLAAAPYRLRRRLRRPRSP